MPAQSDLAVIRETQRGCWCGSPAASGAGIFHLANGDDFPLVRCDGCGVLALWPQPTDEQLAAAYAADYYGPSRRKFIGPVAAIVSMFQQDRANLAQRYIPPRGRVLDIGCGNGGFLVQMKRRGFDVEGTEWTQRSASRVPAETDIPVHVGDLLTLRLPPAGYDLITLWHVFEHLHAPQPTLLTIRSLLKPGGTLIMSMPNAEGRQAERFGTHWFHHDPPRHLFGFGPRSLERLLEITGFSIERISTWSFEQNPYGYVQSRLNAWGFPRDRAYESLKGSGDIPWSRRLLDFALVGLLAPPAMLVSAVESMRGRGATMTVVAR
jgi:SAM-dependent methyltransferase